MQQQQQEWQQAELRKNVAEELARQEAELTTRKNKEVWESDRTTDEELLMMSSS
jgi:hypothetical protein